MNPPATFELQLPMALRERRAPWRRWWHALRAGWQAARWVLAQARPAPRLAPQALGVELMDDRMLADMGLPPGLRAQVAHQRVRDEDQLWVISRGAVRPGVERSFY